MMPITEIKVKSSMAKCTCEQNMDMMDIIFHIEGDEKIYMKFEKTMFFLDKGKFGGGSCEVFQYLLLIC